MYTQFLHAIILYVVHSVFIHMSTLPKITHSVCQGDKSRQKQPSTTRKHKGHKGRKTVKLNESVMYTHLNIWDADVKDIYKTIGFGLRWALCYCSYAQGMRRNFQKGTLLGLRSPRACLSHCGSHLSGANIKQLFIQHFKRSTHSSIDAGN